MVIPLFNESRALPALVSELLSRFSEYTLEVVLVDDGSTDDSAGLAEFLTQDHDNIQVIRLPLNSGKGAALRAGIGRTTSPVVVFMDADLSTSLEGFDTFLDQLSSHDIVIASRAVSGAVVRRSTGLRTMMGRYFNRLMRSTTGLTIEDSQCGLKVFRGDVARLIFSISTINRFAFDPEILRIATALGYSIAEIPVIWTAGDYTTVRPVRDSLKTAFDLLPIRFRTRPERIRGLASRSGLPIPRPISSKTTD